MPKRTEVIKKIEKAAAMCDLAFSFKRHGGNHDIYDLDGVMIPIERHRQLDNGYANMVYRQCEVKLGKGWWK
jgi:hypothetical protein